MVNTITSVSSRPTAPLLIIANRRVEAMTITASTIISTTVITRAVPSSSAMPSSGISAILASALLMATTPNARMQKLAHPNHQPTFGLASREPHW